MNRRTILLLILCLAIGFASVTTSLIITGVVTIGEKEEDWDVYFSEAKLYVNDTPIDTVSIIDNKKKIEFSAQVSKVNDVAKLDYKVFNNSTQYNAEVTINCTFGSTDKLAIVSKFNGNSTPTTEEIKSQEELSGFITSTVLESVTTQETVNISCTLNAKPVSSDKIVLPKKSIVLSDDKNENGVADVGDMITIDTERFYVYSNDGVDIRAISEWNLEVGNDTNTNYPADVETNLQSPRAFGQIGLNPIYATVRFAQTNYWTGPGVVDLNNENSNVYNYLSVYKGILTTKGANIDNVTLIELNELESLGCDLTQRLCNSAPAWLKQTAFWTKTASDNYNIWRMASDGILFDSTYGSMACGIRPVIVFKATEL